MVDDSGGRTQADSQPGEASDAEVLAAVEAGFDVIDRRFLDLLSGVLDDGQKSR